MSTPIRSLSASLAVFAFVCSTQPAAHAAPITTNTPTGNFADVRPTPTPEPTPQQVTYLKKYANSSSQKSTAKSLTSAFENARKGDRAKVRTALNTVNPNKLPSVFNQTSPSFFSNLTTRSIEHNVGFNQQMFQRFNTLRLLGPAAFQGQGDGGTAVVDSKKHVQLEVEQRWNVWVMGSGQFARNDNVDYLHEGRTNLGGFAVGLDYRVTPNLLTGFYVSSQYTDGDYRDSGLEAWAGSAGVYASYNQNGCYLDAIIGGGLASIDTHRAIQFSGIDRIANGDTDSGNFNASINFGKDWQFGRLTVGPVFGAQYTHVSVDGFTETGAGSLNLAVDEQHADSLRTSMGAHAAYTLNLTDNVVLVPEVSLFWQHEFLDGARPVTASLQGGGSSMSFITAGSYRDTAIGGAGISAKIGKRWTTSAFYNVLFGNSSYQNNMVSATLSYSF